ncbi:MAG TPA: ribosomal-processing cysteine protease Prp [Thermotogota bacterium]|nr:ribosomal-processing cysteine protease Prp [Thermotogota bacterium]HPJ88075.1 ribosomal-processing cysteine protease Prp [Thermotogota bacterium]HPR96260.1 ribosomal-processing cysteine protease Prp [Thermotogota bacterium]
MIHAVFYKNRSDYIGFTISGHSGYSESGSDIVCAAVSAVALHTSEMLLSDLKLVKEIEQGVGGYLRVELKRTDEQSNMLIMALERTLSEIRKEYSGYLSVEVNK